MTIYLKQQLIFMRIKKNTKSNSKNGMECNEMKRLLIRPKAGVSECERSVAKRNG